MSYSSEVLADSPSLYLRLGESSGTTATDSSGNGATGTYQNTPTLGVAGPLVADSDTAVTFASASSQYVSTGTTAVANSTTITLEAWIKSSTLNVAKSIIDRDSTTTVQRAYQFRTGTTGKLEALYWLSSAGLKTLSGNTTLVTGTWYHVAFTYDGTIAKLYVNGVAESNTQSFTDTIRSSTNGVHVARNQSAAPGAQYWNGTLDEVAVYPTALSATRIMAHYLVGSLSGSASISLSGSGTAASGVTAVEWNGWGVTNATVLDAGTGGVGDNPIAAKTGSGTMTYASATSDVAVSQSSTAIATYWQLASGTTRRVRFYVKTPTTSASAAHVICAIASGGTTKARLSLTGSATARGYRIVDDAAGQAYTSSSNTLSDDTWYRVEWLIDQAGSQSRAIWWDVFGTQVHDSGWQAPTAGNSFGASHDRLYWGNPVGTITTDYRLRNLKSTTTVNTEIGPYGGTASISLSASGVWSTGGTASITLSGAGTAKAASTSNASLSLSGSATTTSPASASAALDVSATATPSGPVVGTASVALSASTSATSTATGSASLTLSGSADPEAPSGSTATLTLSASGDAAGPTDTPADGTATLTLSASADAAAEADSSTAALTVSASAAPSAPAVGSATLDLTADALATEAEPATGTASITLAVDGSVAAYGVGAASLSFDGSATSEAAATSMASLSFVGGGELAALAAGEALIELVANGAAHAVFPVPSTRTLVVAADPRLLVVPTDSRTLVAEGDRTFAT